MSRPGRISRVEAIFQLAVHEGLLPPNATCQPASRLRVIASMLAGAVAWAFMLSMLYGLWIKLDTELFLKQLYLTGPLLVAVTTVALQRRQLPWLIEQIVICLLLVGLSLMVFGVFRDLREDQAPALTLFMLLGMAALIKRQWLQWLFGAMAAVSCALVVIPWRGGIQEKILDCEHWGRSWLDQSPEPLWFFLLALYSCLGVWMICQYMLTCLLDKDRHAQGALALESFAAGWLAVILTVITLWASLGSIQKIGGGGGFCLYIPVYFSHWIANVARVISVHLCAAAMILAVWRWPVLKQFWLLGAALPLLAASWLMPSLGAVFLIFSHCITSFRKQQAIFAGVVGVWSVIHFGFHSNFSLETLAWLLLFSSALLGLVSFLGKAGQVDCGGE
ncbi:DUF4401 domain-containing protein [Parachitinimonas caeni]|uniref:DUF4401 domain-containing protein n=1 Tax=Parachitinimonas caeni TaxID=3031301 RepID=A0ABT7DX40_9NEIS|nr:DUF4401 domain-containing protein [Parachitinimonas caeni]MDK2124389.1 DUF4401 domain-containing protein [Parachitinimonas caeni]